VSKTLRLFPELSPTEIAAAACPSDPLDVIDGLRWALSRSMKSRANGTLHLDSCRNARVNASWFECQKECTHAQILLIWADTWISRHPAAEERRARRLG
jgi:hypothetical protein